MMQSFQHASDPEKHVVLTPEIAKLLPTNRLISEAEWQPLGVQKSRSWVHYAIYKPEPHIMLCPRRLNYQQNQTSLCVCLCLSVSLSLSVCYATRNQRAMLLSFSRVELVNEEWSRRDEVDREWPRECY
ncbi:hypothetical protein KP509_24G011600 [Ceratopteris richardii]|uniref:Cyclin-dependent kinases regulatory subunit n=1 Tax=Ceratopteris richardii TaxID=49495 RepID=A0A8T2RTB1_CERRI|nr:hypothetical protein KP509_24G011600 [Ceratopteris richardii]